MMGRTHDTDAQAMADDLVYGPEVADLIRSLTPEQLAEAIGGRVEPTREPYSIPCPTCGQPIGVRCRRQGAAQLGTGKILSGVYDGVETEPHPARKAATCGVRVVGPFVRTGNP